MDRLVELLDNACSANGLACTRREKSQSPNWGWTTDTHEGTGRDPEIPGAPRVSDGKGAKGQRKLVVPFLAHASGARAKLESEQFVPEEGVTTAVVIGVVGGTQGFLELPYPLTHLGDLTVKLLRVSENEPEGCSAKQGYMGRDAVGTHREPWPARKEPKRRSSDEILLLLLGSTLTVWTYGRAISG